MSARNGFPAESPGTVAACESLTEACRAREAVSAADAGAVEALVASTGFFTAEEIAVARELVEERLAQGESSGYFFVFLDDPAGRLVGYACFGPVPCTESSFDLYWIAVRDGWRGRGLGARALRLAEAAARRLGAARLYAETSSTARYAPTRRFYERQGFRQEAFLEDFYRPGDGKVIYGKRLTSADDD